LRLLEQIQAIPEEAAVVLLRGESGVGKDLLGRIVHALSPRRARPLLHVDCAALPPALLEVELFGASATADCRGALPGALVVAGAGTLLLREIAALPMPLQARLLHAIEAGVVPGSGVPMRARVIATSSCDLERAVARRAFRQDLYYRCMVECIAAAPLRERRADIPPLAEHFLDRWAEVYHRARPRLSPAARDLLAACDFPGNVAELRAAMERAVLACSNPELLPHDLPAWLRGNGTADAAVMSVAEAERACIERALAHTHGRKSRAAALLGISRKTLLEKRKRYGIA